MAFTKRLTCVPAHRHNISLSVLQFVSLRMTQQPSCTRKQTQIKMVDEIGVYSTNMLPRPRDFRFCYFFRTENVMNFSLIPYLTNIILIKFTK